MNGTTARPDTEASRSKTAEQMDKTQEKIRAAIGELADPCEPCPDWCCGGDHDPLVPDDVLGEPEHFALIASGVGWSVELTRFVGGSAATSKVTLNRGAEYLTADVDRARSLGAALLRAADLADRDGCA